MVMRGYVYGICIFTLFVTAQGTDTPNIVLILSDDQGYGDVGAYWNQEESDTPNLDELAKNGLRFTDFHAGAARCTPSRASLLTGRLGIRTGVVSNFNVHAKGGIPVEEETVAEVLKRGGYGTHMIGKWHLGFSYDHHPLRQGFDSYLGIPYSNGMGCIDTTGSDKPSCGSCGTLVDGIPLSGAPCFGDIALPLVANDTVLEQPTDLYNLSEKYASHAEDIILKSKDPYFLYMGLAQPHTPLTPSPAFEGTSKRGFYGDSLREMDWSIGRVVNATRQSGKDTIVWFMSDNGPWAAKCMFGGSVGPFIGAWQTQAGGGGSVAKGTVWEGGHRVPSIVYWPGRVKGGVSTDQLSSSLDILPTLAKLGGIRHTPKRMIDGVDISSVILSDSPTNKDRIIFHPNSGSFGNYGDVGAVRMGKYKAVFYTGGYPDCHGEEGEGHFHNPPLLFNLLEDKEERTPLDSSDPRSEPAKALRKILKYYKKFYDGLEQGGRSNTTYEVDWSLRPCCNPNNEFCRCHPLKSEL